MRQSKFTETQIVSILKEADTGCPVNEIWRKYGISSATYYKWNAKVGGIEGLRCEAAEGTRTRERPPQADVGRLVAGECDAQGCPHPSGDAERPSGSAGLSGRGTQPGYPLPAPHGLGPTRCVGDRGPHHPRRREESLSFWKCVDRLRLNGHPWNHKRLWRVYCQLCLNLPRHTKKQLPVRFRQPLAVIPYPNAVWAIDFMSDTLYGGRRFRTLNILDEGVREGLAIEIDTSIQAERVIAGASRGGAGPAPGDSPR